MFNRKETKRPVEDSKAEEEDSDIEVETGEKKEDEKDPLEIEKKNVEILKAQLAQAQAEKESWMNKYYSSLADISNLRKEIQRDNEVVIKYAAEPFLKDLIPFMTSMDQAFRFEPADDPKAQGWIRGIHLSYKQLLQALEKQGVKQIAPEPGDKFDSRYMEAMQTVEGDEPDLVHSVWMKGFTLKDRLIQPAAVVVTTAKAKEETKEETKAEGAENKEAPEADEEKEDQKDSEEEKR